MTILRHVLAQDDLVAGLRHFVASDEAALHRAELETLLTNKGLVEPGGIVDRMLGAGFLTSIGERLGVSLPGQRAHLLAEALDGGDIEEITANLRAISGQPRAYELVREGMTSAFVQSLIDRPGFRRLYICSPWINPTEKDGAKIRYAYMTALRRQPDAEVLVIVRPPEDSPPEADEGVKPFRDIGAQIYINPRVHTKLYIREPDQAGGGIAMAIVGSQNLTRSTHIELGVRINGDTSLISQLIAYFMEIVSRSSEPVPTKEH